ncbi:MAG: DUF4924 family protein [Bacteroidales bacterium]|nr:DUF4924 family protein [Bacteroidales bacterium]
MIIAQEKKKNNIAEYVLYMWQIEDIIRAYQFDIDRIEMNLISQYQQSKSIKEEIKNWYANLITIMYEEKIMKQGHMQFIKNVVNDLYDLHLRLLHNFSDKQYVDQYNTAKININDLEKKSAGHSENEIETCFTGLYALLMFRLQKKEISKETSQAMSTISNLIALLAQRYKQIEDGEYEL